MSKPQNVSESIVIDSSPERVFELLADPRQHSRLDGSGGVRGVVSGPTRLSLGARFGMQMRFGLPYRVTNTVVEYEENRRIAWQHLARHTWSYDLDPVPDGVRVTETWDWSTSPVGRALELVRYPARNRAAIRRTLLRLKQLTEAEPTVDSAAEPTVGSAAEPTVDSAAEPA